MIFVLHTGSSYFVFQQPEYPRDCKEVLNTCSSTQNTSGVYLIKPDGYPEPFEAYCDNEFNIGGWTMNGAISISSVGTYGGTAECITSLVDLLLHDSQSPFLESQLEWCPTNEIFSNETCERTCDDPDTCISSTSRTELEKCVCVERRVFVNSGCTRRSHCSNNQLIEEESYHCSDDATCDVRDGVRRCYCIDGYEGDGVTCTRKAVPKDCQELYVDGSSDGVYTIYPDGWPSGIQVYCEMESNGEEGRDDQAPLLISIVPGLSTRPDLNILEVIIGSVMITYTQLPTKKIQSRIDLTDSSSSSYYALYSSFSISDDADKYRLSIGSYSGNTG
ncbi:putative IgGFc-binding protein-like [Apostichopus japonicus]|uniref:Putative IgGFc-binding protein-like n=1 Tax=Stichopus japonicus TaxID=307972 RepID=A0A2G8LMF5_STIJA|nr:putative IgGFc-binding protein-like [Apostichopus japonicus]